MERERAEVQAPLLYFDRDLPRRHTAYIERDVRVALAESDNQRQQRVNRRLVGADEHAAAPQVAELADGRFGFFGQAHEPLPVVLQHLAGFGQGAGFRRSVEQLLPELDLEAPDRLADGRL